MSPSSPNIFNTFEDACKNTPDFLKLKFSSMDEFPVFIFGTLQKNRIYHEKMKDCKYYGRAKTYNAKYIAKQPPSNRGGLISDPFVFCTAGISQHMIEKEGLQRIFNPDHVRPLEGDVFGVPLRKLCEIDTHYSNMDGFERIKAWVKLLDPSQDGAMVETYLYVVDIDYFLDIYTPDSDLHNCNTIGFKDSFSNIYTQHYTF